MGLFQEGWQEREQGRKFERGFIETFQTRYSGLFSNYRGARNLEYLDPLLEEVKKQLAMKHWAALTGEDADDYPEPELHNARYHQNSQLTFASAVVDARLQLEGIDNEKLTTIDDVAKIVKDTGKWIRGVVARKNLLDRIDLRLRPWVLDDRAISEHSKIASKFDLEEHLPR